MFVANKLNFSKFSNLFVEMMSRHVKRVALTLEQCYSGMPLDVCIL